MRRMPILCALCLPLTAAVALGAPGNSTASQASIVKHHSTTKKHRHRRVTRHRHKPVRRTRSLPLKGSVTPIFTAAPMTAAIAEALAPTDPVLFGDQAIESNLDNNPSRTAEAFPFVAFSTGSASSVVLYVDALNRAKSLRVGLYSDSGGHPGSLLASGSLTSPVAAAWNAVSVKSASVTSGSTYWVAVLGTGGTIDFRDRAYGDCSSQTSSQSSLATLPSSWTPGKKWATCPLSAYVRGTLSSSSPATSPPPAAPANTATPQVTGSTMEGQMVSTSNGSWTNGPTSYSYSWQDCDGSGGNCTNVSGANSSSYTLSNGDVGHTMRAVVTASNAGGSTSVSSPATTLVAAPPPSAPSNTGLPAITGGTTQGQDLSTSNGTWTGNPSSYTYQWQDCDSTGTNCTNITGATAGNYTLTAGDVGNTLRVVVTATNAGGSTAATSAASVVVAAPPPSAPSNTGLPAITGTTTQGQGLSTSNGTWTGNPSSYTYQWQDCDSTGSTCTNISGASSSSYTLASGDVGHAIRVVVTATNSSGSTPATSAASVVVVTSGGQQTNCVSHPSACGYPDATNAGVPAGTQLAPESGTISANVAGQTISNIDLTGGTIVVAANNVTIKDSRITTGNGQLNGESAVDIKPGVTGTLVEDTTMQGSNCTSSSLFAGVMNESGDQQTLLRDYGACLDDILHGSGTIKDSYSIDNATIPSDHYEPVAYDGGDGAITIIHNTLLNPHDQTAAVFVTCYFGPVTTEIIDNNLMAGGDYVIYGPEGNGACNSQTGHQEVVGNRFSKVYFPAGGQYGVDAYFQSGNTTWSDNYWDENLAPASM